VKITVVGSGFVGSATGKGLNKHGNEVTFLDVVPEKVESLKDEGFNAYLPEEYLKMDTEVTMFCVPTPTQGKRIQLEYLLKAVEEFAHRLKKYKGYHVAVIRSTVPPYTTRKKILPLIEKISGKKAGRDFGLCMQPEYLREISAVQDFARPWFVLIGEYDKKSGNVLEKIYSKFDAPIERCTLEEAEFQKYVHNVYNAVKISFFNEMRMIAKGERWNANAIFQATAESSEGMWNPLYGTRDYGPFDGSCLPKDTRALLQWGEEHYYKLEVLRAAIVQNLQYEKEYGKNESVRVNYLSNINV